LYTIPMELPNIRSRTGILVFSLMLAGGNFGNFMGPLIVGYIADLTGSYLPGYIICAAGMKHQLLSFVTKFLFVTNKISECVSTNILSIYYILL
jgi:dipeptide/tripeptide permease